MDDVYCGVCGKKVNDINSNICVNCGCSVCNDDYDSSTGCCSNCSGNVPFCGC